jgi:hypothetical protein
MAAMRTPRAAFTLLPAILCALSLCAVHAVAAAEASLKKKEALPQVGVSVPRGFYDKVISLALTSPVAGALLRYTLDGSEPALANGNAYTSPIAVTNTAILRAAAFKDRTRVSAIATHSYIFLDQVVRQRNDPPGFPSGPRAWSGQPSAYQMDPRVVNDPLYHDRMKDALQSLPVISIVCYRDDLFGARAGLYLNSMQRGETWERACSAEMLLPGGTTAFQIDCGLRIQGNYNRLPVKSPKHSFRLLFKEKYGATKLHYQMFPDSPLKKFDTLVLRADYNNSWIHWDPAQRPRAQRTRDAWMKDSHRAMGWVAGHNRYVHLFLDGLYWGVYDVAERPDADFAAAYFGGRSEDYDVVNEFDAKDGTLDAFKALYSIRGVAQKAPYEKLRSYLDLTQYIDYLLLNYYAGNQDWGENKNWYAIRRHTPPGPFQYIVWDGEQIFHEVTDDTVSNPYETPFRLAEELKGNAEFRLAFADRVQKHFFNGGALTPASSSVRWMKRAAEVDRAVIAESARWGYYRRNPPFTRDRDWIVEQKRLVRSYFPQRTGIVLGQLRAVGLYPKIAAPTFNQHGGRVTNGFKLEMTSANGGSIHYTMDGTDPRTPFTGAVAPQARSYTNALPIAGSLLVKARVFKGGAWSALSETAFTNSPAGRAE